MKANQRKAYNHLKKMGVPLFERNDEPDTFFISAEDAESYKWVDYYNEFNRFYYFGVHTDIYEALAKFGLHAEWENPASLGVWEN